MQWLYVCGKRVSVAIIHPINAAIHDGDEDVIELYCEERTRAHRKIKMILTLKMKYEIVGLTCMCALRFRIQSIGGGLHVHSRRENLCCVVYCFCVDDIAKYAYYNNNYLLCSSNSHHDVDNVKRKLVKLKKSKYVSLAADEFHTFKWNSSALVSATCGRAEGCLLHYIAI